MTFTCSRRSFAAMALAAGLVLPMSASAAGPGPNRGHPTPTPGGSHSQRPSISRHQVSGLLAPPLSTTVPTSLTVLAGHAAIIVTVPATTTVVRGYGGRASLDEFAPGDRIMAQGVFLTSTTFKARRITDLSVKAHSRVVGNVLSVVDLPHSFTLGRGSQYSKPMTVTLTDSTLIVSGTIPVSPSVLQKGMHVLALGGYNRTQSKMLASRVRVLSARGARNAHRRRGT
jgi:hypothetical protein